MRWGIVAPPQEPATTRLGRRLVSTAELRPRLTFDRVLAYAIAVLVHLGAFAFVVGGFLLIIRAYTNPFAESACGNPVSFDYDLVVWTRRTRSPLSRG